ncbi:MAG TPA: class I SAM-dependent methyltransferase [Pyrinomonadaceae bacterium]|nr:class I SAM-dependent methyltransferase [Pyrinomonadaceae bacterium]
MPLIVDPEQNEVKALADVMLWRRKSVLEIGCGSGRLSRRIAALGAIVHAIDPDPKLVRKARSGLPKRFANRINFRAGKAEKLHHRNEKFDVVIFAWSL